MTTIWLGALTWNAAGSGHVLAVAASHPVATVAQGAKGRRYYDWAWLAIDSGVRAGLGPDAGWGSPGSSPPMRPCSGGP